jgi:hypothetical protein
LAGQVRKDSNSVPQTENEVLRVEEECDRGQRFTKEPGLDDLGAGKVEYFSYKQRDYDYYVYGDTVVMTGRTRFCPEVPGKGQSDPTAVHHNPRQSRGQWRLGAY